MKPILKRIFSIVLTGSLMLSSFATVKGAEPADESAAYEVAAESLVASSRPVLLRYIAQENNCTLRTDAKTQQVEVIKNGTVIQSYSNVAFYYGEPVIDGGILERDLGWSACKHVPNTDMFDNAQDAVIAGSLTYLNESMSGEYTYYVGNCYYGYYFSDEAGKHEQTCPHELNKSMFQEFPVVLTAGVPNYDFSGTLEDTGAANVADSVEKSVTSERFYPVYLEYLVHENGATLSYNKQEASAAIYKDGKRLAVLRNLPELFGGLAVTPDTLLISLGFEKITHEPDTDFFMTEIESAVAGMGMMLAESDGADTAYYIGHCYNGYYFSKAAGNHAKTCSHSHNTDVFYEKPVQLTDGILTYEGAPSTAAQQQAFADYKARVKNVTKDAPESAFTKMATVLASEYARPDGVQANYFSFRDRVYRDYWQDIADYDVTDYVFIPLELSRYLDSGKEAEMTHAEYYDAENEKNAQEMVVAIEALLARNQNAQIWVGTPGVTSNNFSSTANDPEIILDFVTRVRRKLTSAVWHDNIAGIYINQESIYTDDYKPQVDKMKEVVAGFRKLNPDKKALWAPYFDMEEGAVDLAKKIAEVANIPNMFDYIAIQPGYFFFATTENGLDANATANRKENVDAIKNSAENNYVVGYDGKPVISNTSTAKIGIEMEPQSSYFSTSRATRNESIERYTEYLMAGAQIKDGSPLLYYVAGDPHCNKDSIVYKFYNASELVPKVVNKKLTDALDQFFDYVFVTREYDKVFADYAQALYLSSDASLTEESFKEAYKPAVVIPAFYEFEKSNNIECLAQELSAGREMPEWFKQSLLQLLGL